MKSFELIEKSLSYHNPDEATRITIEEFRACAKNFARILLAMVPEGRCKSISQTKLEECAMWAVKGIVLEQPVHVGP